MVTDRKTVHNIRGDTHTTYPSAAAAETAEASILINKISWGAVFSGLALLLAIHLILSIAGVGIGAATIDPAQGETPSATTFSVATAMWWIISGIIAAFIGGYVSGRVSGKPSEATGGWHGLTTWALGTLVIFYMLSTTMGALVGGTYNIVTDAASGVATATSGVAQTLEPAAGNIADTQTWNQIENRLELELNQRTGGLQIEEVRQSVLNVLDASLNQNQSGVQQARQEAIDIIAETQNISQFAAEQRLETYMAQAELAYERISGQTTQAVDNTVEATAQSVDMAATRISQAAWASAIALALGALAAWFGGIFGARGNRIDLVT